MQCCHGGKVTHYRIEQISWGWGKVDCLYPSLGGLDLGRQLGEEGWQKVERRGERGGKKKSLFEKGIDMQYLVVLFGGS